MANYRICLCSVWVLVRLFLPGRSFIQKQPEEEDVLVGANPKPLKPIAPEVFNAEERRQKLISQAIEHRRNPGKPPVAEALRSYYKDL